MGEDRFFVFCFFSDGHSIHSSSLSIFWSVFRLLGLKQIAQRKSEQSRIFVGPGRLSFRYLARGEGQGGKG